REPDWTSTNSLFDLIRKIVCIGFFDLVLWQGVVSRLGSNLITGKRNFPTRIGELKRIHAEVRYGGVADGGRNLALQGRLGERMGAQEAVERSWLGSARPARRERKQELPQLICSWHREAIEGVSHNIRFGTIWKTKLDRHASG